MKKPRLKTNNQFGIDFAFPGLCSLCHTEIADFNGSHPNGRPIITKLKGNYRELAILLNDASAMKVALCDGCFDDFTSDDAQELMESEINGWQAEVDDLIKWPDEKKREHMDEYSKKFIVNRHDKPWTLGEIAKIQKPRPEKLRVKVKEKP